MEQKWFNSMLFNRDLEYRCGLSKSMDSFGPIENNGLNEDPSILTDGLNEDPSILTDMDNNIPSWKKNSENSSYSHGDYLVDVTNIQNFLSDKTFLVRDGNRNSYSIDFSFENQIFDIHNKHFFGNAPETVFDNSKNSSSLTNVSKSNDHNCTDNTKSNWNNKINHCIESYLCSQICIDSSILDDSDKYNSHEFNKYIGDILDMGQKSRQQPHIKNEQAKTDPNGTDSYDNDCNKFSVPTDKIKGRDSTRSGNYRDSNSTKIENSNHSDFRKIENSIDSAMDSTRSDTDSNTTATDSTVCRDRATATAMDSIVRNIGSNGTEEEVDIMSKYAHLWVQCESCFGLNYKKFLKSKMNICEHCGDHLKMSSSDRIELSIDPGTWNPMDEDMVSLDPVEWDLEDSELNGKLILEDWTLEEFNEFFKDDEELQLDKELNEELNEEDDDYINRLDSYQDTTGLLEAIQTGTGQLNGIPVAIGIMDFQFMGGSMGSVVGEKITRLIEYATNQLLPLIIVCASGGARMQEGSLSLMQMGKISCALYNYQINKNLFYVTILTSPTTGGVTASFGMLGDIIIAEPKAYLAFAGKRVIEELLKTEVPEGSQSTEVFFEKGLVDLILSRDELKEVLTELLEFHGFFPLTENEN